MPTSSILKKFVIKDDEACDRLIKVLTETKVNCAFYMETYPDKPIGEFISTPSFFENIMTHYMQHFVETMDEILSFGIEWEVITAMLGCDLSKERYAAIKERFA